MKTLPSLILAFMALLSGCSTMNDSFTCDLTAGDSCMTIDAVNAMTEPKGSYTKRKIIKSPPMPNDELADSSQLWIAPFNDEKGKYHSEETIALKETSTRSA